MRWFFALVASCGLLGCFNPDPVSAPETGGSPGTGSGSSSSSGSAEVSTTDPSAGESTEGPAACQTCAPSPPQGWVGPLAVGSGAMAPSCTAPYSVIAFEAAQDIAGDPASCDCACGAAEVDCGGVSFRYSNACSGVLGVENFTGPETCHDTMPDGPTVSAFFSPVSGTEACPAAPAVEIPPATMTEFILCSGAFDRDTCGAQEVCAGAVPEGFESQLCIAQEGEHVCPDDYPQQRSAFMDVADDRRCTSCDCTPGGAFSCESPLALFGSAGCTDGQGMEVTDTCFPSPQSFRFGEPTVSGSCTPSDTEPAGSIGGEEPITICCR